MAADAWSIYQGFKEEISDSVKLKTDSFKMGLYLSTSNAATLTTTDSASVTSEHAAGNGYTAGGNALTTVSWTQTAGTATFDSDDVVWTASGAGMTFRFGVVYSTTAAATDLVCMTTFDNTPADISVSAGNSFTVQINANGYFQLT